MLSCLFYQLNFAMQPDVIAYYYLSGFGYGIPHQPEFFAAYFAIYGKTGFGLAVRIYHNARHFYVYAHRLGNPSDRQVAIQDITFAGFFKIPARKLQLRMFFGMEKIGRF